MRTLARNLRFALSNLGHYSVNVTHIFARDLLSENQFMINYIIRRTAIGGLEVVHKSSF